MQTATSRPPFNYPASRRISSRRLPVLAALTAILILSFAVLPMQAQGQVVLKSTKADAIALPNPGMTIDPKRTAIVITDPQNDFLSPKGVAWGVVGKSVQETKTVEHLEALFQLGEETNTPVFVSPHYYFAHDHEWKFEGALEKLMHNIDMFERKGTLSTKSFKGSGADWLARYKPYINNGKTIVTSPHKVYGPATNDLVLQLRKRGIDKIILAGMSANLCTESHMRGLIEEGFEVAVVEDATAGGQVPGADGYQAAVINFRFIASAVVSTKEVQDALRQATAVQISQK